MSELPAGPVAIIGCGLIGTSVALALRERGVDIVLADTSPDHIQQAVDLGAGQPLTDDVEPTLVVVAVPPATAAHEVGQALERWPDALVTDVTSVKSRLQESLAGHNGSDRYAGGHPMAGSERSGPTAASARLFEGRPWAVTPTRATRPEALDIVVDLALNVGAVPIIMEAAAHDRAVAVVSHVPQVMSSLTAARLNSAPPNHLALSGPGLRDVTRIAGSDLRLWLDILGDNAVEVRDVLHDVRADLDRVISALDAADPAVLADVLESGRRGTTLIPGKHGDAPAEQDIVNVQVADQTGELSRLLADTGQSGVNIEDLRLDHDLGRPVGLAQIAVAPGLGDVLVAALTERGWTAYH